MAAKAAPGPASPRSSNPILVRWKYRRWKYSETLTNPIITGTSTSGPMTAAKAAPEWMPNTATATAIASSKLLLAAVNDSVAVFA